MKVLRRIVVGLAGVVLVASALELVAPKAVQAVVSTLVTVSNTSANPVPNLNVDEPAAQPFQYYLGANPGGYPTFTVPSTTVSGAPVKRLVIESVSGFCSQPFSPADPVGSFTSLVTNDTSINGQSSSANFFVPLQNPSLPTLYAIQAFTRIYADPGATVRFEPTDATGPCYGTCSAQVTGYLVTQ